MASKEDVVQCIKQWLAYDKELKLLLKEVKTRREKKREVAEELVTIMKDNEIDCFDISEGKIIHTQSRSKAPLSKQHLMTALESYFAENPSVEPEEVGKYILDTRTVKTKDDIRHKPPKNM